MKALVFTGKQHMEIQDIDKPEVKLLTKVRVDTAYAGVCGTDHALL